MEKKLWISVIIPIYNGEKFLARAVESVICQMDGQIELILVDDGSTDNSGALCDEYAANNSKIKVIHKENGGTSSAKNMGIKVAEGKYLSFMDCDDYIDSDTYKSIIPILKEIKPDCLDFGWKYIGLGGEISCNHHGVEKNILHQRDKIEKIILPPLLNLCKDEKNFIFDFAVNKIYKAEIIKRNNILFDEDKRTWEDRTFLLRCLKYCNNFYSMDKCFYNYVYTPNSLSQRYTPEYFRIIVENFQHYRELYEDRFDFDTPYVNQYWAKAIWNMILRSVEQKGYEQEIISKIYEILGNKQVIHWFANRKSVNEIELKVSSYVTEGKIVELLQFAKKTKQREQRNLKMNQSINSVKYKIKSLIKINQK